MRKKYQYSTGENYSDDQTNHVSFFCFVFDPIRHGLLGNTLTWAGANLFPSLLDYAVDSTIS